MKTAATIALALLLAACNRASHEEVAPPTNTVESQSAQLPVEKRIPPEVEKAHALETDNLLNVGYGAAVLSRTGELTLESSAIRAIDGDADSMWASPPRDFEQTLVFSLPAPARVEKVGIRTPRIALAKAVTIELSADGRTFVPAASPRLEPKSEPQLFDVEPREARYVRVTTTGGAGRVAALQSVHLRGSWMAERATPSIAGCWTINGTQAWFGETAGRANGTIGFQNAIELEGGSDGAAYRFGWTRGPEWGYAFVTLAPDGSRLSGMTWHEEAAQHSFGTSLFGERRPCLPSARAGHDIARNFLQRAGWFPLFGLRFDSRDALVAASSTGAVDLVKTILDRSRGTRLRIVSREYHETTADANRRRAEARLESLRAALVSRGADLSRVELVALGSAHPRRPTATEVMRLLYGVVEIELSH